MIKVNSYVNKAIKANGSGVNTGMLKTAIMVTTQAKAFTPVDKGQLRGSIMWRGGGKTGSHESGPQLSINPTSGYVVGTAVEYAVYQEYGTRKMPPQPYLRPSIDIITKGSTAKEAMKKAMIESVSKAVPK